MGRSGRDAVGQAGGQPTVPAVLVIEDEPDLREVLRRTLTLEGWRPVAVATGIEGVRAVDHEQPEVVLLDLGLPDLDGSDVLREIRRRSRVGVIVVSARDATTARVEALRSGADDYVVKPFSMEELLARVAAVARRAPHSRQRLVDGGLELDLAARQVLVRGVPVPLTTRELELLGFLCANPGRAFTRAELLDHVWSSSIEYQDPATVTEHVRRIREKLGDESVASRIVTVRGVGYRYERAEPRPDLDHAGHRGEA